MKQFAEDYPDFPFVQVPLAKMHYLLENISEEKFLELKKKEEIQSRSDKVPVSLALLTD